MNTDARALDWRVLIVGLGTLAVPLDAAVNVAFPAITRAFGLPLEQIQWIVIVYMLAQTSLMLVFGRIGDIVGYRRIFLIGTAVSTVALLLCSVAPTYNWVLAGRVAQGVGAGLLLSCGPALATSLRPESMRTRVLGLYTMLYSAGFAIGPAIAGVLVAQFGWPSVFWFRAPIALVAFGATWALPPAARRQAGQRFDALGAVLLIAGISAAVFAIGRLQHLDGGYLGPAATALVACGLLVAFVVQERRAPQPIIDVRFFALRGFARINLTAVLSNLAAFSVLLLLPFYLARIAGLAPREIGLVLACAAVGMTTASPVAGWIAGRIGSITLAIAGCALMAAGLGGVAAAPSLYVLVLLLFVGGFGQGLFGVAYLDLVTAALPVEARGVAGSLAMLTRTIGVVLGASLLTLAYQIFLGDGGVAGFLPAFQGVLGSAALLPAGCAVLLIGIRRS